jgi:hypothetical protein
MIYKTGEDSILVLRREVMCNTSLFQAILLNPSLSLNHSPPENCRKKKHPRQQPPPFFHTPAIEALATRLYINF